MFPYSQQWHRHFIWNSNITPNIYIFFMNEWKYLVKFYIIYEEEWIRLDSVINKYDYNLCFLGGPFLLGEDKKFIKISIFKK